MLCGPSRNVCHSEGGLIRTSITLPSSRRFLTLNFSSYILGNQGFPASPAGKIHLQCRRPQFDSWVGKIPWWRDRLPTPVFGGFCVGSVGKESACNAGSNLDLISRLGTCPGGGHGDPHQYSCLENPYGQSSLAGCSPRGGKESDTTKRLSALRNQESYVEVWVSCGASTKIKYNAGSLWGRDLGINICSLRKGGRIGWRRKGAVIYLSQEYCWPYRGLWSRDSPSKVLEQVLWDFMFHCWSDIACELP